MAPMVSGDQDELNEQIRVTTHHLYNILVQVQAYDASGPKPSKDVLAKELRSLDATLQKVHRLSSDPDPETAFPHIPAKFVEHIDKDGRNPDVFTRELVEKVRRNNQQMKGKQTAFASFRDVLAHEMGSANPEMRDDVARVLAATGGAGSSVSSASSGSANP